MKQIPTPLTIFILLAFVSPLYADFGVTDHGTWPDSWPKELEPLRKQSRPLGDAKTHVDAKKSAPVTPLLTFTLDHPGGEDQDSKGRVKMRFWIDSDSPPCMSDVSVAVGCDFLSSSLRYAPQLTTCQAFKETFRPCDGSGCYYVVDGYFGEADRLGF